MAKPSLPDHVDVGPHRYALIADPTAFNAMQAKERSALRGITDGEALTIHIDPELPASVFAETVLHETLHTVMNLQGVRLDISDAEEERLVTRVAPALLDVLRRNPDLVAFLVAE